MLNEVYVPLCAYCGIECDDHDASFYDVELNAWFCAECYYYEC